MKASEQNDLAGPVGQRLALTYLTKADICEVARTGAELRPVEGNAGTNATDVFVRQDDNSWYVAVFNYTSSSVTKALSLSRLGITGSYVAQDLWSGTVSAISGTTWHVSLDARQAKLFRLRPGSTRVVEPTNAS